MAKETFSSLIDMFKSSPLSSVTLVCNICGNKFSVFRKKKPCVECQRLCCPQCLRRCRDREVSCRNCFILTMRPPVRSQLLTLRVKDLQQYLNHHNVSTRGCVEKEDLVNVLLQFANFPASADSQGSEPPANTATSATTASASSFTGMQGTSHDAAATQHRPPTHSPMNEQDHSDTSSDTSFEMIPRPGSTSSSEEAVENPHSSPSSDSASGTRNQDRLVSTDTGAGIEYHTETAQLHENQMADSQTLNGALNASLNSLDSSLAQSSLPGTANNSPNLLRDTMAFISCEAALELLTVKQLKDMLIRHRVNYRGCCEKGELIDRAKILYRDYCASKADVEKLDINELCKICMDAPVECVMLECGHMATCVECGRQLSECPICRQYVVRIVRTFKA